MNAEIKAEWIRRLRSGEYQQGRNALRRGESGTWQHCCLGVLCDISKLGKWSFIGEGGRSVYECSKRHEAILPDQVRDWVVLEDGDPLLPIADRNGALGCRMSALNDSGCTFPQLADIIEYFF